MTAEHSTRYSLCMCPTLCRWAWIDHWPKTVFLQVWKQAHPKAPQASALMHFCQSSVFCCTPTNSNGRAGLPWLSHSLATAALAPLHQAMLCTRSKLLLTSMLTVATWRAFHPAPVWCLLAFSAENFAIPHAISSLCRAFWATVSLESES